ncbi:hypothetical protein KAR91_26545 [Candidatus Pacearchaeota archaeon]|nr:hypothetical protein [Candidatus Pacearchaeota archaeon]
MKTKEVLKPRGVRISDTQWALIKKRAARENKKKDVSGVTPSDVVRHAISLMEEGEEGLV